jgi:hypothetical protein
MPLIATSIEHAGVARIFFDMREVAPSPDEERQIAAAMECTSALAAMDTEAGRPAPAE